MIHPIFQIDTDKCTDRVIASFNDTMELIKHHYSEFITPEHLLYSISQQREFKEMCRLTGANLEEIQADLLGYILQLEVTPTAEENIVMPSAALRDVAQEANEILKTMQESQMDGPISITILFMSIHDQNDTYAQYVINRNFDQDENALCNALDTVYTTDIQHYMAKQQEVEDVEESEMSGQELFGKMMASANRLMGALHSLGQSAQGGMDASAYSESRQEQPQREPWEEMVTCINDTCHQHNPLVGRGKELERAIRILCRKDKNNPLFIGEPGVGKTAMIYGLASLIENPDTAEPGQRLPQWLREQRIYSLDISNMVAGASYHGELEKRLKSVLEGARQRGNCIIFIDDIHSLVETGGGNQSMNAGELLKPYLEDGSLRFIGCTTYQDYNKSIAKKKALARCFSQIDIKEPSTEEALQIILALLPIYEKHHGVRYAEEAVRYAVEQSDRHIHDRFLPDKAIDLIDEAGAFLQQNPLLDKNGRPKASRYQKVDQKLIAQILTDVCRIDAQALASDSAEANDSLRQLDERICRDIYGQDEAIRQVTRAVMMSKAGLTEPGKPIASMLFVGPTGVGKTEVCKVLARELGIELVRFDMSEYTEKHTISKLIGSPAGYVGYDEGGLLTDAIRKTPNCVLLLDEIEKAHTDIYNILLQVMDYARLTDNKGNKADFQGVVLIMTSNAGAQFASQASIGFGGGQSRGQAMQASLRKVFKPEFLNRLSGTVVFNDMDEHMASLILDKKLRQLSQRLESRGVTMDLSSEAHQFLLHLGFNAQYGAREMDRVIQQRLTPLFMEEILFGKLRKGGRAKVLQQGDALTLEVDTPSKSKARK